MRIALNAQLLSFSDSYRSGGISRVIYHTLVELGRDARGNAYEVFVPEPPSVGNGFGSLGFHASGRATQRPAMRIMWEQTLFARELRRLKPDLVHGMAYSVPAVAWSQCRHGLRPQLPAIPQGIQTRQSNLSGRHHACYREARQACSDDF